MQAGRMRGALALVLLMTAGGEARAQVVDGHGAPYRRWDVSVGGGVHGMSGEDMQPRREKGWNTDGGPSWVWSVTARRNWNGHVTTEAGYAGFDASFWLGVSLPAQTPMAIAGTSAAERIASCKVRAMAMGVCAGSETPSQNEASKPA